MKIDLNKALKVILGRKSDKVRAKGIYTLTKCDVSSPEAQRMALEIPKIAAEKGWKAYREALDAFHAKYMISQVQIENMVVDRGLEMLARIVTGDVTYTGVINYCALGDSNTAVNGTQTTLGNEVHRKLVTGTNYSGGNAYISTFFNQTEIVDTIEEVGHYVDGTATVDTGRLFSRIEAADTTELPVTKSITETLTIDYKAAFARP